VPEAAPAPCRQPPVTAVACWRSRVRGMDAGLTMDHGGWGSGGRPRSDRAHSTFAVSLLPRAAVLRRCNARIRRAPSDRAYRARVDSLVDPRLGTACVVHGACAMHAFIYGRRPHDAAGELMSRVVHTTVPDEVHAWSAQRHKCGRGPTAHRRLPVPQALVSQDGRRPRISQAAYSSARPCAGRPASHQPEPRHLPGACSRPAPCAVPPTRWAAGGTCRMPSTQGVRGGAADGALARRPRPGRRPSARCPGVCRA
jgi:hypothetical protein